MSSPNPTDDLADMAPVLYNLLVGLLSPMFLGVVSGSDSLATARTAAVETLKTFRIRDVWELWTCVQIMCFGMAALNSLGMSMEEGMSPAMVLRLRGTAGSLHRASQQNRHMLEQYREIERPVAPTRHVDPSWLTPFDPEKAQADAEASVAAAERMLAEARGQAPLPPPAVTVSNAPASATDAVPASFSAPQNLAPTSPAPTSREPKPAKTGAALRAKKTPASVADADAMRAWLEAVPDRIGAVASPGSVRATSAVSASAVLAASPRPGTATPRAGVAAAANLDAERKKIWADAMLVVAKEITTDKTCTTEQEQRANALRISALTYTATNLLQNVTPPPLAPFRLPRPPKR